MPQGHKTLPHAEIFCQIILPHTEIFSQKIKLSGLMAQITTTEAAQRLGVTDRRVRQMIEEGLLKGTKIGRDYLVDEESLEAARQRPKPGRPSKKNAKAESAKSSGSIAKKTIKK